MSDLLARGPVVLDGAMGTELDARGVDTRSALWSALALTTAPDVVCEVHSDYLDAGARVITTNTYQATLPALIRSGKDAAGAEGHHRSRRPSGQSGGLGRAGGDSRCCRHQLRGPRCRLDVLHEGGALLEEGWGYCG